MVNSPHFLFHVKIYQLKYDRKRPVDPSEFLNYLISHGWKVLYLYRSNKILHALSVILMLKRGESTKMDDKEENLKINLDLQQFEDFTYRRLKYQEEEKKVIENIDYFEINYEKDLWDSTFHQNIVSRILKYLDLPEAKAFSKYRKINKKSLKDVITNYEDFITLIKRNKWEKYIEND